MLFRSPTLFQAGSQAFFDHQPMRRAIDHPSRIWRSVRWGRTAEFFVLDCRSERKPSTRAGPDAEYVSPAQLDWLKKGLAASPARFKVILNSVPISEFGGALFQPFGEDRWEGYPAQRREILQHIDDLSLPGVLWVAGDFHLASMGHVSRERPGHDAIEVLVGPGAQAPNVSPAYPRAPQFDWSSGINNYTTLGLDPSSGEVEITFHDAADRVLTRRSYPL